MEPSAPPEPRGLFARLPVGRSPTVRVLLIAGALISIACVYWTHYLRLNEAPVDLSLIFLVLFRYFDHPAAILSLCILLAATFVPRWSGFQAGLRWLGDHSVGVAIV